MRLRDWGWLNWQIMMSRLTYKKSFPICYVQLYAVKRSLLLVCCDFFFFLLFCSPSPHTSQTTIKMAALPRGKLIPSSVISQASFLAFCTDAKSMVTSMTTARREKTHPQILPTLLCLFLLTRSLLVEESSVCFILFSRGFTTCCLSDHEDMHRVEAIVQIRITIE